MLLNFPNRTWHKCGDDSCDLSTEQHNEIIPNQEVKVEKEELKVVKKGTKKAPAKKTATKSNKFVASNRSKIYHVPSCDWAKKINPKGKLTFKSKEEAWEKGYRAHDCVK